MTPASLSPGPLTSGPIPGSQQQEVGLGYGIRPESEA